MIASASGMKPTMVRHENNNMTVYVFSMIQNGVFIAVDVELIKLIKILRIENP